MLATGYGFRTRLDIPYDVAIEKAKTALIIGGFNLIAEVDVNATLKRALDADFCRYLSLRACNPQLTDQAIKRDLEPNLLLHYNLIIYEDGDGSVVLMVDPLAMLNIDENPSLEAIINESRSCSARVIEVLVG